MSHQDSRKQGALVSVDGPAVIDKGRGVNFDSPAQYFSLRQVALHVNISIFFWSTLLSELCKCECVEE